MEKKQYNEVPLDDLSGKESPKVVEIRAQEEEQRAAATIDAKKEK